MENNGMNLGDTIKCEGGGHNTGVREGRKFDGKFDGN